MKRWKLVSECQEGDWVYYEVGRLCQVCRNNVDENFILKDGYFETWVHNDSTKVYPLTLHNKVLADSIYKYYDEMHKKKLINGSTWVFWLEERMHELMALDDYAERSEYQSIYKTIKDKIEELEYHKSFLDGKR